MARFAHYYIKYKNDNLFSREHWAERQRHFGAFFETEESISFQIGKKHFKHKIYHLGLNPDVIVMKLANVKEMMLEMDFKDVKVEHNPSCFVIIDNRGGCRRIAIQKLQSSFSSTDQVAKIIQKVVSDAMESQHYIPVELCAERYPKDFYRLWRMQQHHTSGLMFSISEEEMISDMLASGEDGSIVGHMMGLEAASMRDGYRSALRVLPKEKGGVMYVDEKSEYIRSLVRYSAKTSSPIELVTSDGASFECYIDSDLESDDKIVSSEIETEYMNALFENDEDNRKNAEQKVIEFVNGMKHQVDDKEDEVQ